MFCEDCGAEIPDDATFCSQCGKEIKPIEVKKEKNVILALIISFILTGLGIAYAGNVKKGILLFVGGLICNIIGLAVPFFSVIGILIWAAALYLTYVEVEKANGQENPDIIEDFKGLSTAKKIGAIVFVLIIVLAVFGSAINAFSPHHNTSTNVDKDYSSSGVSSSDLDSSSSSSSSSSSGSSGSSGSSETYSSSSNGRDVESHYEGEYGSSDTHGTIYDDGSVESHQTGHTDYGDYKIDSYMDSDGNIHGTVDVGGQTYHVST